MTKINSVQLMANIAYTTAESAKEKASKVEKQIENLVIDTNKKIDENTEETNDLKSMMKQQHNEMKVWMMSMFRNQHAPPISPHSNDANALQSTQHVPPALQPSLVLQATIARLNTTLL